MSVTLHMVASLDGFVARHDDDFSWMEAAWGSYADGVEMTTEILDSIDGYIIGSRTYELALRLGWPYGEKPTTVVTSRELRTERETVNLYSGSLDDLAATFSSKTIWLGGGPNLSRQFLKLGLVNELCLTVVPILLGDGLRLHTGGEHRLQLRETKAFRNGMVDLWYHVLRTC